MLDVRTIANQYPGALDKHFLDSACVGLMPRVSGEAIQAFLDMAMMCPAESSTVHHLKMDEMRKDLLPEAAKLLKTSPDNLSIVESTSHGLNIIASSLEFPEGSEVLTTDMEFLQVPIPWAMRPGLHVIEVSCEGGYVLPETFEKYISEKTKLVVISSTTWCNGFRVDMKAFSEMCHKHGVLFGVDAVQQVGAIATYPEEDGVDFLVSGGHKWLNAPFGCGIMYVAPSLLNKLKDHSFGYLNLADPEGGWGNYFSSPGMPAVRKINEYDWFKNANRLQIGGTTNYPGGIGLAASIKLVNELGIENIEEHVLQLTDYLLEGLPALGAKIVTVPERKYRSGICSFRFYDDIDDERALVQKMSEEGVYVSIRFTENVGGIRVSCHLFNNKEDIDALFECLKRAAQRKAPNFKG